MIYRELVVFLHKWGLFCHLYVLCFNYVISKLVLVSSFFKMIGCAVVLTTQTLLRGTQQKDKRQQS